MAFLAGTSALSGDEDWRTWTLIKVVPERNWASLVRAREHAVLEGEVSERTRAAYDFYRETRRPDFDVRMSFMFMITRSGADSRERLAEWIRRTEEAEPDGRCRLGISVSGRTTGRGSRRWTCR